jgi:hypothetical protein
MLRLMRFKMDSKSQAKTKGSGNLELGAWTVDRENGHMALQARLEPE